MATEGSTPEKETDPSGFHGVLGLVNLCSAPAPPSACSRTHCPNLTPLVATASLTTLSANCPASWTRLRRASSPPRCPQVKRGPPKMKKAVFKAVQKKGGDNFCQLSPFLALAQVSKRGSDGHKPIGCGQHLPSRRVRIYLVQLSGSPQKVTIVLAREANHTKDTANGGWEAPPSPAGGAAYRGRRIQRPTRVGRAHWPRTQPTRKKKQAWPTRRLHRKACRSA